ncbi:MAG: hypothetical protein HZB19_06820 [Chloroflexi bacterium]|nr:hypothetical protein [Chloroflexota bacterium]
MNSLPPFFSADRPYDEVLPWLKQQLGRAGLRVMQTFDLRLTSPLKLGYCPCPHHGTDQCDCQLIVLLVYGKEGRPVSLILHGNYRQTWLSLIDHPGQRAEAGTVTAIQQAIEIQASAGI